MGLIPPSLPLEGLKAGGQINAGFPPAWAGQASCPTEERVDGPLVVQPAPAGTENYDVPARTGRP